METKIILTTFLMLLIAYSVHGLVNCTENGEGRFSNPDDLTCKTFILCVLDTDSGLYLEFEYNCPSTSLFDPYTSICTEPEEYKCPTMITSRASSITLTTSCTENGFFPNPSSVDCTTYLQCVEISGAFDVTILSCPSGSFYNPVTTVCATDYICTTVATTTIIPSTSDTPETTDITTTTQLTTVESTIIDATETTTLQTSTYIIESTTVDITTTLQPKPDSEFICITAGRFADPFSDMCRSYILCIFDLETNTYYGYSYTCPCISIFDPNLQLCVDPKDYECTMTSSVNFLCTANGFIENPSSDDCTSFVQCVQISDVFEEVLLICPNGFYFNPNTNICESNYICREKTTTPTSFTTTIITTDISETTTTYFTTTTGAFENFTCTGTGRFADMDDPTCQSYYLCIEKNENNIYTPFKYLCPYTSVFNPVLALCIDSTEYQCPIKQEMDVVCTENGFVANPNSNDCSTYIQCILNSTFEKLLLTCPIGTNYNPTTRSCELDYVCSIQITSTDSSNIEIIETRVPSGEFTCVKEGRFRDPYDITCQTYYLCVQDATGNSYTAFNYSCPSSSVFDPGSGLCTDFSNYNCDITNTWLCKENGYIQNPRFDDCSTYIQCVQINNEFLEVLVACPDYTFYNPSTTICDTSYVCPHSTATTVNPTTTITTTTVSIESTCTEEGRFADINDKYCQKYILCILDTTSISYLVYNYVCPLSSIFNPEKALCVDPNTYQCTNHINVCTSDGFFEDLMSFDCVHYIQCVQIENEFELNNLTCPNKTYFNPVSTICEINYTCPIKTSTKTTTTAPPIQIEFSCVAKGRFSDPSDPTCQNYKLCVYDSSTVSYIAYNYICPSISVFDPLNALCVDPTNYNCSISIADSEDIICVEDGFIEDFDSVDCSTYIQCIEINHKFSQIKLNCPTNTYYNPNTTICETNYICSSLITTTSVPTTELLTTDILPQTFTCTAEGRFANTSDTTCQTYILCVINIDTNTFIAYSYICPLFSVFDQNKAVCTDPSNYQCQTGLSLNITISVTVSCSASGRFGDPTDSTCQSYFLCVEQIDGTFLKYDYVCPSTSIFNSIKGFCVDPADYICSNSLQSDSDLICTKDEFVVDYSSDDCSSYIQCVVLNNTFEQFKLMCPNNTFYNPNTTICETNYICLLTFTSSPTTTPIPKTVIVTESTQHIFTCTAAGRFANLSDTTCQNYILCVLDTDTDTYTAYDYVCPSTSVFYPGESICTDPTKYQCSSVATSTQATTSLSTSCSTSGRFADPSDTTCQAYYMCVEQTDSSFVKYTYTCPSVSVFDPTSKICSTNYSCPQ